MRIETGDLASFSTGCLEIAKALVELADQGYDCLIIPCRGAFPVLVGVIEALKRVEGGRGLLERFYTPSLERFTGGRLQVARPTLHSTR